MYLHIEYSSTVMILVKSSGAEVEEESTICNNLCSPSSRQFLE